MKTFTYRVLFRKEVEGGGGIYRNRTFLTRVCCCRGFGEPLKVYLGSAIKKNMQT